MKISVYELLGMVKDGKAPSKIKYDDEYYVFNTELNSYYCCDHDLTPLFSAYNMNKPNFIFDEVEILEEEKKIPEKINEDNAIWEEQARDIDYYFKNTIDDIIDYLYYLKSKGE